MAAVKHSHQKLEWHLIDASGAVLGRLATRVATLLIGKHRGDYTPHIVAPVYVVVTNSNDVHLTGKKEAKKMYRRYSGYPGGLKSRSVAVQRTRNSRRLIIEAVTGMLPKNNSRRTRLRHLKVYPTTAHPHAAQLSHHED